LSSLAPIFRDRRPRSDSLLGAELGRSLRLPLLMQDGKRLVLPD
jgi:hypothetical protein